VSFWIEKEDFHENKFHEVVRGIGGDLIEDVKLIDDFTHPKTGKRSNCFRINFRSMERSLTNIEINELQGKIREALPTIGVKLR